MPGSSEPEPLPTLETHSPEDIERAWREQIYRGDRVPQLTLRALVTGALLGAITGLSNLYVGLKVGWSLGVVVTASVLGWALWQGLGRLRVLGRTPTILEANAMASTASAAGYSTGTTLASAMTALLLVTGEPLPLWQLMAWLLSISFLGLFIAAPLKRTLVNTEQLPFPAGAAAAETLRSLYEGQGRAREQVRALVVAMMIGLGLELSTAVVPVLAGWGLMPSWLAVPSAFPTESMQRFVPVLGAVAAYGWVLPTSVMLPAAGVLAGMRVSASILLGALVCHGVLVPVLLAQGIISSSGYRDVLAWSVWPGTTLMTVAGLLGFLGHGRRVVMGLRLKARRARHEDPLADLEVPSRWVVAGIATSGAACMVLLVGALDIPVFVAALSVVLAVVLTVVAARVTALTDITPMGPLGKVAQLWGGLVMPGRVVPGLMAAGVTAGAAASASDLLTDLKSGYLLGAHPRRQFLAQAAGVVVGVAVTAPVFRYVLAPDAAALAPERWPAPAARIWASVGVVVSEGLSAVPSSALWASAIALLVGSALAGVAHRWPQARPWLPSAAGLGLAFVLPPSSALAFFIGGLLAWLVVRRRPQALHSAVVPIAAGLIAGESLMGIVAAVLTGWAR